MLDSALGASDLRTRRSKAALVRAVGELLDSGDTRPSITNVVALAGTSRPTFSECSISPLPMPIERSCRRPTTPCCRIASC